MLRQPVNLLFGAMTLCGALLAALQVSLFSVAPSATAMTASLESEIVTAAEIKPSGKHLITRAADGLFYIDGSINGVPLQFAVDTGASVVVLNDKDALRVGLGAGSAPQQRIRTASGYSQMTWRKADDLTVAGRTLGGLEIAVMESGPEVSLLGLNALSKLNSITIRKDQLIIE
ncbi:TIGR02281 family clan AA aspartic protease [Sphingorhabdus sp. Alg231-15]|uniref:TIGR02281 family clan AA aspartic protease n=1 Tax=Sphingorhabdus sp. Alg231-15 TaxID=1922222 RepID=UPI000D54CE64